MRYTFETIHDGLDRACPWLNQCIDTNEPGCQSTNTDFTIHPRSDGGICICKKCKNCKLYTFYLNYTEQQINEWVKIGLKDIRREREIESKRDRKLFKQQIVVRYLMNHPCADCGESDVRVLEFDHLHSKSNSICRMVANNVSVVKLEAELVKCQVLCTNCHRIKTAREQNSFKHRYSVGDENWAEDPSSRKDNHGASLRITKRHYVIGYLEAHCCIDCSVSDVRVLEFDHQKNDKRYNVGVLVSDSRSLKLLMREIEKCVVRCANCHRRKSAVEGGSYRIHAEEIALMELKTPSSAKPRW
jgi:5-methylcytosine-specific restriction endonuclease McrA